MHGNVYPDSVMLYYISSEKILHRWPVCLIPRNVEHFVVCAKSAFIVWVLIKPSVCIIVHQMLQEFLLSAKYPRAKSSGVYAVIFLFCR